MKRHVLVRRGALSLGVVYVLLGGGETVRLVLTGDGGFLFWFGTLVGGGTLLLVGAWPRRVPDGRHLAAVLVGAVLGMPATAWTLVVPLLALTVVISSMLLRAPPVAAAE